MDTFSPTDMDPNSAPPWNDIPIFFRRSSRSSPESAAKFLPRIQISPLLGCSRPTRVRKERALTRAGTANDYHGLGRRHLEVNAVQDLALAVTDTQIAHGNRRARWFFVFLVRRYEFRCHFAYRGAVK